MQAVITHNCKMSTPNCKMKDARNCRMKHSKLFSPPPSVDSVRTPRVCLLRMYPPCVLRAPRLCVLCMPVMHVICVLSPTSCSTQIKEHGWSGCDILMARWQGQNKGSRQIYMRHKPCSVMQEWFLKAETGQWTSISPHLTVLKVTRHKRLTCSPSTIKFTFTVQ